MKALSETAIRLARVHELRAGSTRSLYRKTLSISRGSSRTQGRMFLCTHQLGPGDIETVGKWRRMIRRGPEAAPDQTEASASLKNLLRPQVLDNPAANAVTINAVSEGVREYALDPGNAEALCEAD